MTIELISANTGIPMGKAKPGGGGDVDETGLYRYMGSVATYDDLLDLDTTNFKPGYVYDVQEDGMDYSWTGTTWNALGTHTDLSNYYTKPEVYTKTEVNTALTKKQNDLTKGTGIEIDAVYANQVDLDVPTPYVVTNSDRDLVPVINTLDNTQRVSIRFHCNVADARTPHFFVGSVEMGPFLKGFGVDYVYNDDSKFVVRMFYGTYPNYIYNQGVSVELNKSDYPNGIWVRMIPAETAETWEVSYSSDNKIWTVAGTSGLSSDYLTNIYYNIWDETVDAPGIIDTLIVQYGAPSEDMITTIYTNEDHIEAHKAYLAGGGLFTDSRGLEDVKYYNHSSFDSSKFTEVGSPTIIDGVASGFSNSDYLTASLSSVLPATIDNVTITGEFTYIAQEGISTIVGGRGSNYSPRVQVTSDGKLGFYMYDGSVTHIPTINLSSIQNGDKVKFTVTFSNENITASATINNGTPITTSSDKTLTVNFVTALAALNIGHLGNSYSTCLIDLKLFSTIVNGQEIFSGNKTGVDTYTIGSDTITIPYKVSKTGSKVVDSSRRPEVQAVYYEQGHALYYTLDETNGNFTLPMGEIYGYITRLEATVSDLQSRLTALESNINAGGAGVVLAGLMGMSRVASSLSPLDTDEDEPDVALEEVVQEEEVDGGEENE